MHTLHIIRIHCQNWIFFTFKFKPVIFKAVLFYSLTPATIQEELEEFALRPAPQNRDMKCRITR